MPQHKYPPEKCTRSFSYGQSIACMISGTKVNVMTAIDMMCESLKRIILDRSREELQLPTILPIEDLEGITE